MLAPTAADGPPGGCESCVIGVGVVGDKQYGHGATWRHNHRWGIPRPTQLTYDVIIVVPDYDTVCPTIRPNCQTETTEGQPNNLGVCLQMNNT